MKKYLFLLLMLVCQLSFAQDAKDCPDANYWQYTTKGNNANITHTLKFGTDYSLYYNRDVKASTPEGAEVENYYGTCRPERVPDGASYRVYFYSFERRNSSRDNFSDSACKIEGRFLVNANNHNHLLMITPISGLKFDSTGPSTLPFRYVDVEEQQ